MFLKILYNICSGSGKVKCQPKNRSPDNSQRKGLKCAGKLALHSGGITELMKRLAFGIHDQNNLKINF